ncbi:MAG: T9SS type A sorting domain-containing protein [Bacteroidia bacterium]|nr:T9SS type A sorting domain-containing protein [Bacteroidia bacterium]
MRNLIQILVAVGLLPLISYAQAPLRKVKPLRLSELPPDIQRQIKNMPGPKVIPLPPSEMGMPSNRSTANARTAINCDTSVFLPWLPPHIDADTLRPARRAVENNIPDHQAGDTVLAVVSSRVNDTLIPEVMSGSNVVGPCFKPYFDSLNARGSYAIIPLNLLESREAIQTINGIPYELYDGNALAVRLDVPSNALPFRIVGFAFHLYNNFGIGSGMTRDCDLNSTVEGSTGYSDEDGFYELSMQIRSVGRDTFVDTVIYQADADPQLDTIAIDRSYTYPDTIITEVQWPARELRVSWFGSTLNQCWGAANNDWRTNAAVAYFLPQDQYQVNPGDTIYLVVASELYDPDVDGVQDSLHLRLGPAYEDGSPNIPLWVSDSLNPLAPKPEGVSMWNLLWRNTVSQAFQYEAWVSVSWTNWGEGDERLRSYHFGIYPVISFDPNYNPPLQPGYTANFKWGSQGFGLPYPNPATECLYIDLDSPAGGVARFSLYTLDGRMIQAWERSLTAGQAKYALDLGAVSTGTYVLTVRTPYGEAAFNVAVVR